ncbi:MAG TPA: lysozyme [Syntrophorhabdus aromaticivorans]|nr:lysozyme [Syntrophorhabdus aromaticivorans]
MARQVSQEGLELVKKYEGLRTQAYRCPAGVWTIGYGHTEGVKPDTEVTAERAEELLNQDLTQAGAQVERLVHVPLTDNQFSALTSFVFNVGAGNLESSTLLRRLNAGDYDAVPSELAKWVKATDPKTGKKATLAGLVKRRAAEGELWLKTDGDDPFLNSSDMPQNVHADEACVVYTVTARSGLKLREGPGMAFDVLQVVPYNTRVFMVKEKEGWAAVDLQGDGAVDGWMSQDFLSPLPG